MILIHIIDQDEIWYLYLSFKFLNFFFLRILSRLCYCYILYAYDEYMNIKPNPFTGTLSPARHVHIAMMRELS